MSIVRVLMRVFLLLVSCLLALYLYIVTYYLFITVGINVIGNNYSHILKQLFESLNPAFTYITAFYYMSNYTLGCILVLVYFYLISDALRKHFGTRKKLYLLFTSGILLFQVPICVFILIDNLYEKLPYVILYFVGSVVFMLYFVPLYQRLLKLVDRMVKAVASL